MKHPISMRLASAALSGALVLGSTVPAYAAGQGSSDVTLRVQTGSEPSIVNVTVPTEIPLEMDKDGKVTVTQDLAIKNLSDQTALELKALSVTGKNGWTVKDFSEDLAAKAEGTKELAMSFRGDGTTATGDVTLTPDNWNIDKSASLAMNAAAKLPKQSAESESKGSIAQVNYTFAAKEGTVTPDPGPVESQISNNWSKDKVIKDSVTPVTFSFDSTSADTKIVSVESSDPSVTVEKPAAAMFDLGHPGQEVWNVTAAGKGNATVTATLSSGEQTSFAVKVFEMKAAGSEVAVPSVPDKKPGDSLTTGDITVDVPISTPEGDSTITVTPEIPEGTPPLTEGDNKIDVTVDVDGVKVHITIVITIASSNPSNGLVQSVQDATNMGFTFTNFEDGVAITKFENKQFKSEINVPEMIGDFKVLKIGDRVFKGQTNLKKISLPDTVKIVGNDAFSGCTGLVSARFEGVETISKNAFLDCTGLTEITLNNKVKNVENDAFSKAGSPNGFVVNLGWSVDTATNNKNGDSCFYSSNVSELNIGSNVTEIPQWCFGRCAKLNELVIPDNVQKLERHAFSYCNNLSKIELGSGLKTVDLAVFKESGAASGCTLRAKSLPDCIGRPDYTYDLEPGFVRQSNITDVIIEEGVTHVGEYFFADCDTLKGVQLPDSITSIGSNAFARWRNLTSIDIPVGVTSIGSGAFSGCINLNSIVIPDGIKKIENRLLSYCSSLMSFDIPSGVTSIGDSAFEGCKGLTSLKIPAGVTSIGGNAFRNCTGFTTMDIPSSVTTIGGGVFQSCTNLTSVSIPDGVTSIGSGAFQDCTSLKSIPNLGNITSIEAYMFAGCTALTSIDIPDRITYIDARAFRGCTGATSVTIPDGVTTIRSEAFKDCTGVGTIKIPDGVSTIHYDAFQNVPHIEYHGSETGGPWGAQSMN